MPTSGSPTCAEWRQALADGGYTHVVTTYDPFNPGTLTDTKEALWTRTDPAAKQILRDGPVSVFELDRAARSERLRQPSGPEPGRARRRLRQRGPDRQPALAALADALDLRLHAPDLRRLARGRPRDPGRARPPAAGVALRGHRVRGAGGRRAAADPSARTGDNRRDPDRPAALVAAAIALRDLRRTGEAPGWQVAFGAVAVVLAATTLPFLISDRVGVLGEGVYTNDHAAQLYWSDWLQHGLRARAQRGALRLSDRPAGGRRDRGAGHRRRRWSALSTACCSRSRCSRR